MLARPDSAFHVHDAVLVPEADVAFALRLARYCTQRLARLHPGRRSA